MGQKGCPIGFRIARNKKWRSSWFANKKEYGPLLLEDIKIRRYLAKRPSCAGASEFAIQRTSDKVQITIHTSRPGLAIGKKGAEIEVLRKELKKLTGKEIWVEVEEIKRPDLDATLVADSIAKQLERRVSFRRAMKKAIQSARDAGALGVKVRVSGRLGGAEIARAEWYIQGQMPLHTLRADIRYGTSRAETTYGCIGVKVWIYLGDETLQVMETSKGG